MLILTQRRRLPLSRRSLFRRSPRAVHSYGIYPQNEFWVHSDGNGLFYVIHMDDLTKTTHDDIEAKVDVPAHGKLVWDEDPAELGSRGFATSTGEPFLFEIDLANKVQTSAYDFSSFARDCTGLHAIAYSGVNNHVYAECAGPGGILEFDVSGGTIAFVHQFENATGALYETPKGDMVVASNKGGNLLHVFLPNEPGAKSSLEHNVPMPGNPSTVSFYTHPVNGGDDGETETIVCAPLTENLNQNHRREDGSLACDPYGSCTGAATADDAEHGVCLHESNPEVSFQLMRVMEDDTTDTTDLPAACARCADAANFNFEEGSTVRTCVCTPSCGLCDTEPDLSDDASGYMCINLSAYIAAETSDASTPVVQATLIANAGGVRQGAPFGEAAECSFGHAYRPHKRGTKYDASISTVPTNSIVVVNMDAMEKTCQVDLPGEPSRVLYAPLAPVEADGIANGGDGGSGAAGSSIIGGGVAGRIVMLSSVAGASYILLGLLV